MKRGLTYALLFCFLLTTVGYFPLLELNKLLVKNEIRELMLANHSQLLVIRIAHPEKDPDFRRIDQREFRYKGKMYDIATETKYDNATVFLCLNDKKEENLFNGLKKVSQNKLNIQWWENIIKIVYPFTSLLKNGSATEMLFFPRYSTALSSIHIPVNTPPPEFIF
ncbi:MAG: hypothetical protein NT004_12220 [Bacteroidetes bacterium]|nr:hypothetical protein [Bacteroidota bacterium]